MARWILLTAACLALVAGGCTTKARQGAGQSKSTTSQSGPEVQKPAATAPQATERPKPAETAAPPETPPAPQPAEGAAAEWKFENGQWVRVQPAKVEEPQKPEETQKPGEKPATQNLRRVHVFVSGRVQGVGFRNFTKEKADALALTGWVQNLADGRVEAVVEGPTAKVAELLEHLKRGPSGARVDKLDSTDEPYKGEFAGFADRR